MKKILACLLALTMIFALASCGGNDTSSVENTSSVEETVSNEETVTGETAVDVLNKIWASYADEEKFMAGGGDADNTNTEGPGVYGIADADALYNSLTFPTDSVSKIKNAASLMNMMNANFFTCAAYQLNDAADAQAVADAIKSAFLAREWMCGFPERLYVVSVGDVVVSAYGVADFMNTYVENVGTIEGATVLVDTPLEIQ